MADFVANLRNAISPNTQLGDQANLGQSKIAPNVSKIIENMRQNKAQKEQEANQAYTQAKNDAAFEKYAENYAAAENGSLKALSLLPRSAAEKIAKDANGLKELIVSFSSEADPDKRESLISSYTDELYKRTNSPDESVVSLLNGMSEANQMLKHKNEEGNEDWLNEDEKKVGDYYLKQLNKLYRSWNFYREGRAA